MGTLRQIRMGRRAQEIEEARRRLFAAIDEADMRSLAYLLQDRINLNFQSEYGRVPLLYAIKKCPSYLGGLARDDEDSPVAIFHALLAGGANPNYTPLDENLLPLTYAISSHKEWIIKDLLRIGSYPDYNYGLDKITPLCQVIIERRSDLVESLLRHGADPNRRTGNEETSVHYAARSSTLKILECLKQHQADFSVQNVYGQTALHIFCKEVSPNRYDSNDSSELVLDFLIQTGLNLNTKDKFERSAASYVGPNCRFFEKLAKCGIEVSSDLKKLHAAVKRGDFGGVKMLLESEVYRPIDLNTRVSGRYPLELALKSPGQCVEIIGLLVRWGADPQLPVDGVPITKEFDSTADFLPNDLVQRVRENLRR